MTYIPDAKAFTDAPPSLMVLMKQRRRWMNGALFGTAQVIANFGSMISCGNKHGIVHQLLMFFFMFYLVLLFLLQFFTIGAMFATIIVFYNEFFFDLFELTHSDSQIITNIKDVTQKIFFAIYMMLLILSIFVSIALPIQRAMAYFHIVAVMMAILVLLSLAGICYFLAQQSFFPEKYDPPAEEGGDPIDTGTTYFSLLVLAGVIMLSVYMLPFIMRPIDFL